MHDLHPLTMRREGGALGVYRVACKQQGIPEPATTGRRSRVYEEPSQHRPDLAGLRDPW
jgi:hypothetical protein